MLGSLAIPTPLDIFHGEKLKNAMLGLTPSTPQKRTHGDLEAGEAGEGASTENERRVRPRGSSEDNELARRADLRGDRSEEDEGMAPAIGDEDEELERELEQGRHAPTPLPEDQSSIMPWNLSASQRSSALLGVRQRRESRAGSVLSGQLGAGAGVGWASGPGRRLTSASPLFGRGSLLGRERLGSLVPAMASAGVGAASGGPSSTSGIYGADDLGGIGIDDDAFQPPGTQDAEGFEQYGPAANVETQLAATSQWVRQTLDREAENFMEFVESAVVDKRRAWLAENTDVDVAALDVEELLENAVEKKERVEFEELLPPRENTNVVAAQGLLHALTLASRGLLVVVQKEDFGAIELGLVERSAKGRGKARRSVLGEEDEANEAERGLDDGYIYEDIEGVEMGE